ncbi:hypothetical protein [Herbiconiux sp.]|uniref:hypothetical protein n=1 Tax=Herbiconiux sp. TaxID=1871186 RepID=UPI0025C60005|nr:hypothetical protein [Herbiconiux sp.]
MFSDDVAEDVRSVYRALLEEKVEDVEAARRTVAEFAGLDEDELDVLWIALAAAQFRYGRLDDEVRDRAIRIIDSGSDARRWSEASVKDQKKRRDVLAKLRGQLVGPQKARSAVRAPWRSETDLEIGSVLAYTSSSGKVALAKVVGISESRYGRDAVFDRLEWFDDFVPEAAVIERLGGADIRSGLGLAFSAGKASSRDEDWRDVGFELVARLEPDGQPRNRSKLGMRWPVAVRSLEAEFRREASA